MPPSIGMQSHQLYDCLCNRTNCLMRHHLVVSGSIVSSFVL
ncbi:hypothetical protein OROGR_004743 [Orobanche gracilis]